MGFLDKFSEKLGAVAFKINSLKYVSAIKHAFTAMMPIIITGAFAVLIKNVVFDPTNGLAKFAAFAFLEKLTPIASAIQFATLNMMTIYAVVLIGREIGKLNGLTGGLPSVLSVLSYICVISTQMEVTFDSGVTEVIQNVISRDFTDAKSLFLGMFIAILSVEVYSKLLKVEALKVKMPDTVPSNVAGSFSALFPVVITAVIIATFAFVFEQIFGVTLSSAIYLLVQKPLEGILQGLPGLLGLMFVAQIFWVIGIHGNQMIKPIRDPILLAAIAANADGAGNIITMPFWDMYMSFGGSGVTLGLLIAIFIASKRADYRAVAKLSFVPGLFNINETVIFGLPIILNPILAIPFVIAPLVTGTIGYLATVSGFAGIAVTMVPWTTPPILSALLATNGSWGAVITQIICIVVSVLIYLPFVIITNKTDENAAVEISE